MLLGMVCAAVLAAIGAPAALALPPLTLGFSDDPHLTAGSLSSRLPWIERAVFEGGSVVRVDLYWATVAPATRPAGFDPADPASPGYDWSGVDATVRDLADHGLRVLLTISDAPSWAEAPHRPGAVQAGSWRPDPQQFGLFAAAAARRYSGSFLAPQSPASPLPRVSLWQAWNEPNLDTYLSPQWVRAGRGWRSDAPFLYRRMLNAFYAGVKGVSPSNLVLMGGTAPYGDPPGLDPLGQQRTAPVAFYRDVFCVAGTQRLRPASCPGPVHLDAIDHHPYGVGGPTWHALNPDDVAVPDLSKITRVLAAGERWGHVLPGGRKAIWITELGWSSRPPNPQAVAVNEDARWYEQAFYVLWRQGAEAILPLELGDPPPIANYQAQFESGLYYSDGRPKPIARAFRFPFITQRARGGLAAWGRAPQSGRLQIDVRRGARWIVVKRLSVAANQVFLTALRVRTPSELRAVVGAATSLTWHQS